MLCIGHQAKPLFLHFLQNCALITQMYKDIFKTSVFHRLICVIWALSVLEILSWYQQRNTVYVLSVCLYFKIGKQWFISLMTSAHNMSGVCTTWESEAVQRVSMGAWEGLQSKVTRYRLTVMSHRGGSGEPWRPEKGVKTKYWIEKKRNLSNLFAAPSHVTLLVVHLLKRSMNYSH